MNPEIKNFLINQEVPEVIELYEEAWDAMVSLNHTEFAIAIDEMMMLTPTSQIESFAKNFREHIHANMDVVIEKHGIFLKETAGTRLKINILNFFKQIEVTEFIEPCVRLLESDEQNNTELFCEIVNIVSCVPVEDLIEHIEPISEFVITNLRKYMNERESLEISIESLENDDLKQHYKELEQYCRVRQAQNTIGYFLAFKEDGMVGRSLDDLVSIYLGQMNRSNYESFAKEIIALALNSDSWKSPQVEIERVLPTITENLKELAEIQRAVVNELQLWKR